MSTNFGVIDSGEVSLKGNVYDFSFEYDFIDKFDILNIIRYLMVKIYIYIYIYIYTGYIYINVFIFILLDY